MARLDYAPPPPRLDRLASFFLLFVEVNAIVVFALSGFGFWMALVRVAIELANKASLAGEYVSLLTYYTTPFMLSSVAWTACQIVRRMST